MNALLKQCRRTTPKSSLYPIQRFYASEKLQKNHGLAKHKQKKADLNEILKQYNVKVGFEIHCQMLTDHKLFSSSLSSHLSPANTRANFVDMALPGMLPVLNEECLNLAIKASLALKGRINKKIGFDRKHYFYADLPQGYQITQKDYPIMEQGNLMYFDRFNKEKNISIERIQIEQDSAKSFHDQEEYTLIDYNRAGMALIEIVTDPEINHPEDGKLALTELQDLLKSLGISEANMEEGQMRCDVNISMSNEKVQGSRVEVKNVLGLRFVEKTIEYEIKRHAELLNEGQYIIKETRRYDSLNDRTISMRSKEVEQDYRFMADPDLPRFNISDERISQVKRDLRATPFERKKNFSSEYRLEIMEVQTIFNHPQSIPIFEQLVKEKRDPKAVFTWVYVFLYGNVIKKELEFDKVLADNFQGHQKIGELIDLVQSEKLSLLNGKEVLYQIVDGDQRSPAQIATDSNMLGAAESVNIDSLVSEVLAENPKTIEKIKSSGKEGPVMFLVGQAMKKLNKQGDPQQIKGIIKSKLGLH